MPVVARPDPSKMPTRLTRSAAALEARLLDSFEAWAALRACAPRRPLSAESAAIYRDMWRPFARFCAEQGLELQRVQAHHLTRFLNSRGSAPNEVSATAPRPRPRQTAPAARLTHRHVWRMLSLIDRVTRFDAQRDRPAPPALAAPKGPATTQPNPAAHDLLQGDALRHANAGDRDPLPEFLTDDQADRLIAWINQAAAPADARPSTAWKTVRDGAAVAVLLGGGLGPQDARSLRLADVICDGGPVPRQPWKLRVAGNGNTPAREAPLAPWAGAQLARWLATRTAACIAGDCVFAAVANGRAMSHPGFYESVRAVMEAAGVQGSRTSAFMLRHTFALRQLAQGHSEQDVAGWMGIQDVSRMARYRRLVRAPVQLV